MQPNPSRRLIGPIPLKWLCYCCIQRSNKRRHNASITFISFYIKDPQFASNVLEKDEPFASSRDGCFT
ncbi:predicted protein [Sclerotinia sclerotiorum 1980 UF-70]|uniref:Uncharacterized protein n=1 Tax=Sclerotinia sclerotiorum (strain ATCC 18683 / 1980 / Ss-1) TaxID=665079 RepID=A7F774_SCLS1|nr:predicted protein [Sclerotinia sclerotiorum 1980 UF-70]EDN98595.1 predicted protein [Sclerotinia sclerotiorum 1980 UF-70]